MKNILELIKPYKTVAVIGMGENTGKTTTLNSVGTVTSADREISKHSIIRF